MNDPVQNVVIQHNPWLRAKQIYLHRAKYFKISNTEGGGGG